MKVSVVLLVNGKSHTVNVDPATPLLYVLRNQLKLNGPKYGCGLQQCGACMVLLEGKAQPSCMIAVSAVKDRVITTLEGVFQKNKTGCSVWVLPEWDGDLCSFIAQGKSSSR